MYGFDRTEGGIPPLVELLESTDSKVQRAAAGALRTLAFKNEANKNQVSPLDLCWIMQSSGKQLECGWVTCGNVMDNTL